MRIDLPQCNFKNCRFSFDGNCTNKIEYDSCEYRIEEDELIKAEPVRHGAWNIRTFDLPREGYYCSECGTVEWRTSRFCPNCGAKMDGGEKKNE